MNEELVISKRERNMKYEEEKLMTKKNYLKFKETDLSKREVIITNQDKIILEVQQDNKKFSDCVKILERDVKKYKAMETEFKALKIACGLD